VAEAHIFALSAKDKMKRRLKINGIIMFCAFLLVVIFPNIFFRSEGAVSFDIVTEIFGISFILLGQILRASSRGFKAEYSGDGQELIQAGPYALVRNPMYLGILLIGIGIVALLFKWWVICIFLSVFVIRYLLLIFKEERKLLALFSKEYQTYCKKVPRILPSLKVILKTDIAEYLPLKLSWLKKEIGTILTVLLFSILIESWEDIKNEGLRVYLKEAIGISAIIVLFIYIIIYLIARTKSLEKDISNKSQITL